MMVRPMAGCKITLSRLRITGMPAEPPQVNVYPRIWRWHFYAVLLVAPVLIVVALTGAILIFSDQLERVLYPYNLFVTPAQEGVSSYEEQLKAAREFGPKDYTVAGIGIDANPLRATAVLLRSGSGRGRVVYVDHHTGKVIGDDS